MTIDVRRTTSADWQDRRDLRPRAVAQSPAALGSSLTRGQTFSEEERRDHADGSVLVYADGAPVAMGAGFAGERPGHLEVVAMWTEPSQRCRGLGGRVLDEVVAIAVGRGLVPHLFVMRAESEVARLSERHGFVRSGLTEVHGGRAADQLVRVGVT